MEIPDGASELITVVAGLEAVSLQQQQRSTGKENNKVSDDLLDDKCSSQNNAVRQKELLAVFDWRFFFFVCREPGRKVKQGLI